MNDVLKKAREVYFNLRYIERITDYSRLSQYENKMNNSSDNLNGFLFIGDSITEGLELSGYINGEGCIFKGVSSSHPSQWLNNVAVKAPSFTGSTAIFSNVASNQVTPFVPYPSLLTDTLYVFATGTTSPLIAKGYVTSLTPSRSYTSSFNGSYNGNLAAKGITTFANY